MELGCGLRESIVERKIVFLENARGRWRRELVTPGNRACWGLVGLVPIEFGLVYMFYNQRIQAGYGCCFVLLG